MLNKVIVVVFVGLGMLIIYGAIRGALGAEYIFQQIACELEILIGVVMILGGLILDKLPSSSSLFQTGRNFPKTFGEDVPRNESTQRYSGNVSHVMPTVREEIKKRNLSGLSKPACECQKKN